MSSVDVLIEAILTEAHEIADKIIQDAKKKVHDTLEEQRKKGKEIARERVISIDAKAQEEYNINKLRNIASAEMKAKWLILEKEHKMIDKVLNQVKDELITLIKTEKYAQVLENLIIEGSIILDAADVEVILNDRDSNLPLDLDKLGYMVCEKTGLNTKITKSTKNIDAIGGAIIQTTDGKIVMNNTFERIFELLSNW